MKQGTNAAKPSGKAPSPSAGQADAAPGQPMAVTLGKGSRPAAGSGKGDVVMASDDPQSNRQSLKGAENDPSRAGAPVNMASVVETIEVNGEVPQARFGHTITIVSKSKVVLFGGATGDTGKYSMTGETYIYNILNKSWQKLQGKKQSIMILNRNYCQ